MNVFLRKIAFCYGKLPARPAKPVDTMRVLQTANDCGYMKDHFDSLGSRKAPLFTRKKPQAFRLAVSGVKWARTIDLHDVNVTL